MIINKIKNLFKTEPQKRELSPERKVFLDEAIKKRVRESHEATIKENIRRDKVKRKKEVLPQMVSALIARSNNMSLTEDNVKGILLVASQLSDTFIDFEREGK